MSQNTPPKIGERYLVDTNVLVPLSDAAHAQNKEVQDAVTQLTQAGHILCVAPQNLIELWNTATRPTDVGGFGLSAADALVKIEDAERAFTVLPDAPQVFAQWKRLVTTYQVKGKQVHDTRLAAFASVYKVDNILTYNEKDFRRFAPEGLAIVTPPVALATLAQAATGNEMVNVMLSAGAPLTQIPKRELAQGMIQISIAQEGKEDVLAWASPDVLRNMESLPTNHGPFSEAMLQAIRVIKFAIYEHKALTLKQWEDGFKKDQHPETEIAIWLQLALTYKRLTEGKNFSRAQRRDYYMVLYACINSPRENVLTTAQRRVISDDEVLHIVEEFYANSS